MPYASLAPSYAGRGCVLAAPVHRRVEDRHATRLVGRRDTIRVDEGLRDARIREVAHAVVANALRELESSLLLLGRPLVPREPRRLEILAPAERVLERRRVRIHRRAVRDGVDRQCAGCVWVREGAYAVAAHAFGELHDLRASGRRALSSAAHAASCGSVVSAAARASTAGTDRDERKDERHARGHCPSLPCHWWLPTCSAMKWPHVCVAALRMVMPPGLLADGILVVSMSGCPLTGSGKSGTPFARTHWANLRAADSCAGVSFALKVPGGCKDLHAATAFVQTAGVTLTPYDGNWPDASGSGKSPTPLVRMHSVNFTAFCRGVSVRAAVLVVLPVSATAVEVLAPLLLCAPPQPAPAAATTTTKPARGQRRFLM